MPSLVRISQTREMVEALADDFEASVTFLRERAAAGATGGPQPAVHSGHGY